jgi:hypothetical protein
VPQHQTMDVTIPYSATSFSIRGVTAGQAAFAEVVGTELVMHPAVRQRAEELVELSEEFHDADGRRRYTASLLGRDNGTMLTVIRSFDVITEFTMEMPVS